MTTSSTAQNRGEIWTVRFDPAIGAEIQKIRPAAIVNTPEVGRLPLRIVVPLTDWRPDFNNLPWFIYIASGSHNKLLKDSGADAFQIKSVACSRFVAHLGYLTDEELDKIIAGIALCVGYRLVRS
jgi:mRNA interferase MazF